MSRKRLGDHVADALRRVGFAPCAPCKARQEALNRLDDRARQAARDAFGGKPPPPKGDGSP